MGGRMAPRCLCLRRKCVNRIAPAKEKRNSSSHIFTFHNSFIFVQYFVGTETVWFERMRKWYLIYCVGRNGKNSFAQMANSIRNRARFEAKNPFGNSINHAIRKPRNVHQRLRRIIPISDKENHQPDRKWRAISQLLLLFHWPRKAVKVKPQCRWLQGLFNWYARAKLESSDFLARHFVRK